MEQRQCSTCRQLKPVSAFYCYPKSRGGGPMCICKECQKAAVRANRNKNITYYRAFDKRRDATEERRARRRTYQATEAGAAAHARALKRSNEKHDDRYRARNALNNAVRDGKVKKPKHCAGCKKPTPSKRLHGHHTDYAKPLDVTWLCDDCHEHEHHHVALGLQQHVTAA